VNKIGATTRDGVRQATSLFAAGRGEALKRFLAEEGAGREQRFWRPAQAPLALYPPLPARNTGRTGCCQGRKAGDCEAEVTTMVTMETLKAKREHILRLAERWGARHVRVFGSVARGDTGPQSDVDFVVHFEPDRSLLDHGGLLMDLQDLLGCEVDVVDDDAMRPRFRDRVLKEAVPL